MNDSLVVLAFPADSASHHSNGSGSPEPLDHPVAFFEVADDVLFDTWYAPPGAAIVHTDNLQVSVEDRQLFDRFQGCIRLHCKYQHCDYGHFVCHRHWGSMMCAILKVRFEVLAFRSIQIRRSFLHPATINSQTRSVIQYHMPLLFVRGSRSLSHMRQCRSILQTIAIQFSNQH